jgi:hypothetical protein
MAGVFTDDAVVPSMSWAAGSCSAEASSHVPKYYFQKSVFVIVSQYGEEIRIPRSLSWRLGTDDSADDKPYPHAWVWPGTAHQADELLQIEEGSLYPALQRMLKTGWLQSEMGVSAQNRPVRIFKLTEERRKRLEEERSSFEKMFAGINRVLAVAQS